MIVVTGAAGIVGSAVVKRLSEQGSDVAALDLADHLPDMGQALSLGGVDLTNGPACEAAFAKLSDHAPVTGLTNIAGGFVWEPLASQEPGQAAKNWERMFRLNVLSAVNACAAALPFLRKAKGGAIVNVAAAAAHKAGAGMGAYTASKSAVMRLTESLAAEEMANGVRVNAVLPSIVDTPQNRADMPDSDPAQWVSPHALADVIAFLLGDQSRAITGANLPVTGKVGW